MEVTTWLAGVRAGEPVAFEETLAVIDGAYRFTPTAFSNGPHHNRAGDNNGSCRIFAFARLHGLSEGETLALFGQHYRERVLAHPGGSDHTNIRQFMRTGWAGIRFAGEPLTPR